MADFENPVRNLPVENLIEDLRAELRDYESTQRPWGITVLNPLLVNGVLAAPSATTASGSVTENREYAVTIISDETSRESAMGAPVQVTLASAQAILQLARWTDREINAFGLYTRLQGGTVLDWRLVEEITNPGAGTWTYTDNHTYGYYLGNPPPLYFSNGLQVVCGAGFRLRRIKVSVPWDYAASTSAYWKFGIEVRADEAAKPRWQVTQDTQKVGLQAERLWNIPFFHQRGGVPNTDLNLPLYENERVYFTQRGVGADNIAGGGALSPLPPMTVMVSVTREAG